MDFILQYIHKYISIDTKKKFRKRAGQSEMSKTNFFLQRLWQECIHVFK